MDKRLWGMLLFAVAGIGIGAVKPFAPELTPQGHAALMAILVAVGLWIFATKWVPLCIGSMVMLLLLIASGLKPSLVFNGYTTRALWILIPALFFGFALNSTGLGKRLAYWVIGLFRPSYLSLTVSWVLIGLLLSVLTPSISVRIAIVIPIAVATLEICRLRHGSKGAALLLLSAWSMVIIPGGGWFTGSLWGPLAIGFFGGTPELQGVISFDSWWRAMLLPSAVLSFLFVLILYRFMKPAEDLNVEQSVFQGESKALGAITFQEKATFAILLATFFLLVTGRWNGIPDVAVCLGAFVLLAAFGIIKAQNIGTAISWDFVLFLGTIMGFGLIFQETGLATFLSRSFSPVMAGLAGSAWLLAYVLLLFFFVIRFVDVAQLYCTIAFVVPFLPMLAADFHIHPLVVFFLFMMGGNCFFMAYQQPFVILGETLAAKAAWTPAQLRQAGIIYFFACLLTLAISLAYWKAVGLIG
ncbi:MAG: SLC13 family permease [Deltaproteobacteria bacterium]|nr:SLC13 family permease [Deltaproteobacteria bacterium]